MAPAPTIPAHAANRSSPRRRPLTTRPQPLGRSPPCLPVDLVRGEHGSFAADALRRAGARHDDAAETRANSAAHVLLHRHLEERLPTGGRRSGRIDLAGATLP